MAQGATRVFGALRTGLGVVAAPVLALGLIALVLRLVTVARPLLVLAASVAPTIVVFGAVTLAGGRRPGTRWRLLVASAAAVLAFASLGRSPLGLVCLPGVTGTDYSHGDSLDGDALTVYSHNVLWSIGDPDAVADQILASGADVIALQESDEAFVARVSELVDDVYPHVVSATSTKTLSLATFSRYELYDPLDTTDDDPGRNPMLVTSVRAPGGSVRVANIHLSAPRNAELSPRWLDEFALLRTDPFAADVLIGDFNASTAHKPFRELLAAGYVDGHAEAGCGTGTTWTILGAGPSWLHLDHALVADGFAVEQYRTGGRAESDHRAIIVTVRPVSGDS